MTFNADAVADLLGVEEAMPLIGARMKGTPRGVKQPGGYPAIRAKLADESSPQCIGWAFLGVRPKNKSSRNGGQRKPSFSKRVSGRRETKHKHLRRRLSIFRMEDWCTELLWP